MVAAIAIGFLFTVHALAGYPMKFIKSEMELIEFTQKIMSLP